MKILKLALSLIISAAMFASCNNAVNQPAVANPLIGQWKIDSIASKDSNAIGALLLAMSLKDSDSMKFDVAFEADTVALYQKDTVSKTRYHFNAEKKEVLIDADSTVLAFKALNDSSISLTSKDSTVLFLRKNK